MSKHKFVAGCTAAALAAVLAACSDEPLAVENQNSPDVARAYGTPSGVEGVIATTYQQIWTANIQSATAVLPAMLNFSFESYAALGNFAMNIRNALPRLPIANSRGNVAATENFRDFSGLQRTSRTAANALQALDSLAEAGQTLPSTGDVARARSFAFFTGGVSLGNLALVYDSAAIVTPAVSADSVPPLSGATDVMAASMGLLDSALAIAQGSSSFSDLPTSWMNGNTLTRAQFVRVIRSYRARFRANVARTPAQRAAVDWAAVIADATNGVDANFNITLNPSTGWDHGWMRQQFIFTGWHQMTPMIIGMADTSKGYDAWLAQPVTARGYFLIRTPDQRFPSGDTRAAQQANSPAVPTGVLYFRNRAAGGDTPGEPWGISFYDHYRFQATYNGITTGNATWPLITKAEMDMLAAEGYLRTNRVPQATALIDVYRTRAGLPALSGVVTSATDVVPGGNACVPRVPTSAGNAATCGTVFEALKWEKRMETAFTGWGQWYLDSRGWGDLPEGTALEFPVPYQELDARGLALYELGGGGGKSAAPKGTYGL